MRKRNTNSTGLQSPSPIRRRESINPSLVKDGKKTHSQTSSGASLKNTSYKRLRKSLLEVSRFLETGKSCPSRLKIIAKFLRSLASSRLKSTETRFSCDIDIFKEIARCPSASDVQWRWSASGQGLHVKWECRKAGCRTCLRTQFRFDDSIRHGLDFSAREEKARRILWDRKGNKRAGSWRHFSLSK